MLLGREDKALASAIAAAKASLEMQDNGHLLAVEPGWEPCEKRKLWQRLNRLDPADPNSLPSAEALLNTQLCAVRYKESEECHLDQRTRYNRACFFVRSQEYEKALRELQLVFAHMSSAPGGDTEYSGQLLRWAAESDPGLAPLRENRGPEFEKLIERATTAAQGSGFTYPDIA